MDTEQLRNLHKLKEEGILSEEEFQAQKQKLLDAEQSKTSGTSANTSSFDNVDSNQYAMFIHLSLLIGLIFPWIGLIVPLVLWLVKKEDPIVDQHGRVVVNWLISSFIYSIVAIILMVVLIGIPMLLALVVCHFVFAIIGGMKAKSGELWQYPLSIKFLKV
ncbi:MAG: DUF4870 domain-containing protein [Idiomarina sp.]|nr:DUF4870 domain-containing protein [Idiomarina sp.]